VLEKGGLTGKKTVQEEEDLIDLIDGYPFGGASRPFIYMISSS
jgi:hypothetical protein